MPDTHGVHVEELAGEAWPAGHAAQEGAPPAERTTPWPAGQVSHWSVAGLRNSLGWQAMLHVTDRATSAPGQSAQLCWPVAF